MEKKSRGGSILGMLSLVEAMGGRLESRIRLQKSAYLLKAAGVAEFGATSFRYHHYGPYSRGLSEELQDTIASNLLREERREYQEEHTKYAYELTEAGRAWLEEHASDTDPRIRQLAPLLLDARWRTLELAATVLFVEDDEHVEARDEAVGRALALKPACGAFRTEAETLLERMGL